jgi:tetratricopeptide (TPR) repeat protein
MIRPQRKPTTALCALLISLGMAGSACSTPAEKPDAEQALETEVKSEEERQLAAPDEIRADSAESPAPAGSNPTATISGAFESDLAAALEAASNGDRDSAVASLQELTEHAGGGFLAAFNLGVIYENEGDYTRAAKRYSQALSKNPDFSPALLNLVRLYIRLGQPADAGKIARQYSELRPDNMTHRAVALEVDLHQGKYEEAIRKAKQILRRDETNVSAMLVMAQANIHLDRAELADAILQRARELRPNRAEIYFKFGQIRVKQEKMNEAIALFRHAVELSPDYPEAHNNLGILYHRAGDYQAAADEFSAAIADFPDYKEAYLNLGNALKGLGEFARAEASFKKALKIDADYDKALFNLGVLYLDSDLEGIDKIAQLNISLDYFARYKNASASGLSKDDPADKYIKEARKSIEMEKARQQMMRQAQMQVSDEGAAKAEDAKTAKTEQAAP